MVAGCGVAGSALVRSEAVHASQVEALARQGAFVEARVVVTSDPVLRRGQFEPYVVFRVRTESVVGRGQRHRVRAPVLVIADKRCLHLELGSRVRLQGRLQQARTRDLAGVLSPRGPPVVLARPGPLLRAASTCATPSGVRWRTGRRGRVRWCRRWWTATTRGCRTS